MGFFLLTLGGLAGLAGFVCFVLIVVKMFQNNQTGVGVASIILVFCGVGHLVALIFGWMKAAEWNIKNLMLAYTALLVGSTVLIVAGYALVIKQVLEESGQL